VREGAGEREAKEGERVEEGGEARGEEVVGERGVEGEMD